MTLPEYLRAIDTRFRAGNATEHSYRGDLQQLLETMTTGLAVTNEPRRVACGAPDYILTRKGVPVGYIEAKDIGKPLDSKDYKEQFDRYRKGLDNLIITDYLDFRWYRQGEYVQSVKLAEIVDGKVRPLPQNADAFAQLIQDFTLTDGLTIRTATQLAEMMAGKARMLDEVIKNALLHDTEHDDHSNLHGQYAAFRSVLMSQLTVGEFSDIYAQTVTYGMFAARLHDDTPDTFSRQEAAELIPKTNPFLRWLFADIAGPNIDERIVWIVDALADIFRHTDMAQVLKTFGKSTGQNDPLIHFYEPFLAAYSPALRKSRGVWYTPQPVVNFIVRAVDDILKTEFNLPQGLADTGKVKVKTKVATKKTADRRSSTETVDVEKEVHRVQILDPATGTGTFLAEVIRQMHAKFKGKEGMWPKYVDEHLLPRLNGFELLMASYAMAHLKLDMVLRETGVDTSQLNRRLKVYLTNSLEEADAQMPDLFSAQLAREASEANAIKRDTPVMVVLGNPPYSGISKNNGEWISRLIDDYKYVDGEHFNERKHWLNDDYVKFLRFGQHFIEKNGEGVLAYINNHSFLDNPTFRGMRWHLLKTFDKIYVIDLHGNATKKEVTPEGEKDDNVFDIQAGVSINVFVKTSRRDSNEPCKVYHYDLWGKRSLKYDFVAESNLNSVPFTELKPSSPNYFFVPKDEENLDSYNQGVPIEGLFVVQSMGITSARDFLVVDIDKSALLQRISEFSDLSIEDQVIRNKFFGNRSNDKYLKGDTRGWKLAEARKKVASENHDEQVRPVSYRPFDVRSMYYSPSMVDWGREEVMQHMTCQNISLCLVKLGRDADADNYQVAKHITDKGVNSSLDNSNIFPLYLYPDPSQKRTDGAALRPNLDEKLAQQLAKGMGCTYAFAESRAWKHGQAGEVLPLDILDYIYAVLHSPAYREKYKEFLKIDFPRVPWPTDEAAFRKLVKLGAELRQYHLMEHTNLEGLSGMIGYPVSGDDTVTSKMTSNSPGYVPSTEMEGEGRVYINDTQYFEPVPLVAWEFYIGGYQPAQKWLKDRVGRTLSFEDIAHYQRIIVALLETDRLMREVDGVERAGLE